MKKNLKYIVVLVILIFIINNFRNYIILKNIYELGNNFEISQNYRIKKSATTAKGTDVIEFYYIENKYLYIKELNNANDTFIFHDLEKNEYEEFISNENDELISVDNPQKNDRSDIINGLIYSKNYNFLDLLKKNIFKIIKEDEENYILNIYNQDEYINKTNGLLTKIKSKENNVDIEIIFEENTVNERTVDKTLYNISK